MYVAMFSGVLCTSGRDRVAVKAVQLCTCQPAQDSFTHEVFELVLKPSLSSYNWVQNRLSCPCVCVNVLKWIAVST